MTYKQSQALGGQVREGERSQIAIFYKSYSKIVESPVTGDTTDEMRRVLRSYAVFNADQIEGLPEKFYPCPVNVVAPDDERSEEHTSELQSLMRISYAVFCLKKKIEQTKTHTNIKTAKQKTR